MKNQGKNINLEADIKDLSAIELEAIVGGRQTSINTDSITYDEQYKPNPIKQSQREVLVIDNLFKLV